MRPQSMIVALLALVFGGSAAVGVNSYISLRGGGGSKENLVPVLVAATSIPRGGTITADLITTRDYPKDVVPEGAISKSEDAIDRAVSIPLIKGEPILDAKLSAKGSGRGLAALVPVGMRAVTIQTPNVATGVAGMVMPGNRVDVLLTVSENGLTEGGATTTLLQRVEVLAVDQRVDSPGENKADPGKDLKSVTLLVSPQQANLLDLAQNKGVLRLSLRNHEDKADGRARPVSLADLKTQQGKPWDERIKGLLEAMAKAQASRPAPPPAPAAEVVKTPEPPSYMDIRIIRGSDEGSVRVFNARRGSDRGSADRSSK